MKLYQLDKYTIEKEMFQKINYHKCEKLFRDRLLSIKKAKDEAYKTKIRTVVNKSWSCSF
jgi:hypothetical protein